MKGRVSPYKEDIIIDVNKDLVHGMFQRCESVLGLPSRKYEFDLHYGDDSKGFGTFFPHAEPALNRIALLRQDYEGAVFHEAVHYVMSKNGLFLMDIESENLYSRLVDETVAELATSETFGYHESQAELLDEFLQASEPAGEEMEKLTQITGLAPDDIRGTIDIELEMARFAKRFVDIEAKYAVAQHRKPSAEHIQTVMEDARELNLYFSLGERVSQYGIASMIARYNAERMNQNGIHGRDLVSSIGEALQHNNRAVQIFFERIADPAFIQN